MSDEINHRRSRFLETASLSMAGADPASATYEDALSSPIVEVPLTSDDGMNRVLKTNNNLYPAAVLAELSILVRHVRATSPDSALAAIADAKIGRSIALGGNDNTLMQGASRGGSKGSVALLHGTAPGSAKSTKRSATSVDDLRTRDEGIASADRFIILLVIVLAFVNAASTVLMLRSWSESRFLDNDATEMLLVDAATEERD